MFRFACVISLFAAMGSASACAETIHAVGSTTVFPVIASAAKAYHQLHPGVTITVSGGGSGVGIASIIHHTAELGMASRDVDSGEKKQLNPKVRVVTIAKDAVAVVVSKQVVLGGVHQLSLPQIASIYRGKVRNWKQFGGRDAPILVIDKEPSRGTRHVFAEAVLGSAHARAPGASLISGSNNEEQAIVARSNNAIGMLSNAWLNDKVRALAVVVDGTPILPTLQHVQDGTYPISRGLHLILPADASRALHDFVAFLLSPAGQKIVVASGYLPIR